MRNQVQEWFSGFPATIYNTQVEDDNCCITSIKSTMQSFLSMGLFDKNQNKDEIFKRYLALQRSQGGEI